MLLLRFLCCTQDQKTNVSVEKYVTTQKPDFLVFFASHLPNGICMKTSREAKTCRSVWSAFLKTYTQSLSHIALKLWKIRLPLTRYAEELTPGMLAWTSK